MTEFFAGLDLGQVHDFSALAIAEITPMSIGEEGKTVARYDLRHLQRFRLGTDYPDIVAAVAEILGREPLASGDTVLALDATGVGVAVRDLFLRARLPCKVVPITIHGGDTAVRDERGWRTPKRDLIAVTQVLLQTARLKIAPALPEAATLIRELADYRVKISQSGHDSYDAREGAHDDVVLAVALACWYGERRPPPAASASADVPTGGYHANRAEVMRSMSGYGRRRSLLG
jgi:hypothetical protein